MNLQVQQNMNNQTTLQYKWSNQVTYGHPQESHGAVAQLDDTGRGLSGNIRRPEGCLWKNNNNNNNNYSLGKFGEKPAFSRKSLLSTEGKYYVQLQYKEQ